MKAAYLGIACIVVIIFAIAGIVSLAVGLGYNDFDYGTAEIAVPIKSEIEQAIQVRTLENKFIYVTRVGFFGGAGAGGLGAPQIFTESADQFVELIPSGESVYFSLEYGKTQNGYTDDRTLKKVYWAFIENRPLVVIYEDIYTHSYNHDGYLCLSKIERFNEREVVFSHPYGSGLKNFQTLCCILGIILLILAMAGIVDIMSGL